MPDITTDGVQRAFQHVHAAALGLEPWPEALGRTAGIFGANASHIIVPGIELAASAFHHEWNMPQDYWTPYVEHYYALDPWVAPGRCLLGDKPRVAGTDAMLKMDREYRASAFYQEFAKGMGIAHFCTFEDHDPGFGPPGSILRLGFYRNEQKGHFGPQEESMMSDLMRSVPALMSLVEHNFAQSEIGRAALMLLEAAPEAQMILDDQANVLCTNDRAKTLLIQTALGAYRSGSFVLSPELRATILWRAVGPSHPHAKKLIPSTQDGAVALDVILVPPPAQTFSGLRGARFAVTLHRLADQTFRLPWSLVKTALDLDDDELRLAQALADGVALNAAARRVRMAPNAAKSAAARLYRKLGAQTQAQFIVRLFGRFGAVP
ncbi:MAG TPA: hypothetical protein DCL48_02345 [Alphaproteobacteria bacterium]|nr:hypothetical protein [Alphaproteobacteria bacterium]